MIFFTVAESSLYTYLQLTSDLYHIGPTWNSSILGFISYIQNKTSKFIQLYIANSFQHATIQRYYTDKSFSFMYRKCKCLHAFFFLLTLCHPFKQIYFRFYVKLSTICQVIISQICILPHNENNLNFRSSWPSYTFL